MGGRSTCKEGVAVEWLILLLTGELMLDLLGGLVSLWVCNHLAK